MESDRGTTDWRFVTLAVVERIRLIEIVNSYWGDLVCKHPTFRLWVLLGNSMVDLISKLSH